MESSQGDISIAVSTVRKILSGAYPQIKSKSRYKLRK
jgi:hypothetical protein